MAGERANDDWTTLVSGVFALFATREECIQVHVGDPAMCLSGASHALVKDRLLE